jgi:DNA-binding LacI/PurR family transcriptional regulator
VGIGLAGPGDIAGGGIDGIALAALAFPPLPKIDQNTRLSASTLAAELADGIAGKVPLDWHQGDAFLVLRRESV